MTPTARMNEIGELAFEHGIQNDNQPRCLWCVRAWRYWKDKTVRVRHSNWYASEDDAIAATKWLTSQGDELISVTCWHQASDATDDEATGGYVGWTIVAEGADGSLLLQAKSGARRRIWQGEQAK